MNHLLEKEYHLWTITMPTFNAQFVTINLMSKISFYFKIFYP
jgi:hypothetical protein